MIATWPELILTRDEEKHSLIVGYTLIDGVGFVENGFYAHPESPLRKPNPTSGGRGLLSSRQVE